MAIAASEQPESGRIIFAGSDFPHPIQFQIGCCIFFFFFFWTGSTPDVHYWIRIGSVFVHLARFRYRRVIQDPQIRPASGKTDRDQFRYFCSGPDGHLSSRLADYEKYLHNLCISFFGNPLRPIVNSIFMSTNWVTCSSEMHAQTLSRAFDLHGGWKW